MDAAGHQELSREHLDSSANKLSAFLLRKRPINNSHSASFSIIIEADAIVPLFDGSTQSSVLQNEQKKRQKDTAHGSHVWRGQCGMRVSPVAFELQFPPIKDCSCAAGFGTVWKGFPTIPYPPRKNDDKVRTNNNNKITSKQSAIRELNQTKKRTMDLIRGKEIEREGARE